MSFVKRFFFIALCNFFVSESMGQKSMTLRQCLEYAATNNIQVQQASLMERMSKNNLTQSMVNFLPTATAASNYNFTFGNSIDPTSFSFVNENSQSLTMNLSSNLTLFNGWQKVNSVIRNKAELEASANDKQNTINNTALQITNLFLQVLLNKELEIVAKKQVGISAEQLSRTKSQIQSGALAETAIYESEAQVARDYASQIQASNNVILSLLQLKNALQISGEEDFDIVPPSSDVILDNIANKNADQIFKSAVTSQPSIRSAQARIASARISKRLALGSLSPTIGVNFNLSDNYFNKASRIVSLSPYQTEPISFRDQLNSNLTKVVGFNLTLPILQGGSRINSIANAKLQEQVRELDLANQKNTLRQEVQQAFNNAKASLENMLANEKVKSSAQKSYEVTEKRFNSGLANSFELDQVRLNYLRAESQYLQAKYTYLLNLKVLDFYQGGPITLD